MAGGAIVNHVLRRATLPAALVAALPLAAEPADEPGPAARTGPRTEVTLGVHAWPDAGGLAPVASGSFDDAGFNLGGAVHWPLPDFETHGIMIGADLVLFPTESNVPFLSEDLILRGGYLTPSLRWYPRSQRRLSIDVGAGVYVADIAEVRTDYGLFSEIELWETTTAGGYVGGTWNFADAGSSGLFASVKVHFFDLGTVRDEDPSLPVTLGDDAGRLSRGMVQLQFGYRWR